MLLKQAICRAQSCGAKQLVRHAHDLGGVPGRNLPLPIENRYKMTVGFAIFVASGLGTPFIMVRHHLTKK